MFFNILEMNEYSFREYQKYAMKKYLLYRRSMGDNRDDNTIYIEWIEKFSKVARLNYQAKIIKFTD